MTRWPDVEVDEALREAAEIGVGALILGLRQVNIARRDLIERVPESKPMVDAVLDQVEALAVPVSSMAATVLSTVAVAVPGTAGDQLDDIAGVLADAGPELLRLSGLTKRD